MNSRCADSPRSARHRWSRKGIALLALPMLVLGCSDGGDSSSATTERERSTSTTGEPTTQATAATTSPTSESTTTTTTSTVAPPTSKAAVPEVTEFGLGAKATYDDGSSVQVFGYEQPVTDETSIIGPPAGSEFAAADVEVCTGSRAQTSLTAQGWAAYGPNGGTYQSRLSGPRFPAFLLGQAFPGQCIRGYAHFVVPTGEKAAYLVWQEPGWESAKWRTS